MRLKIPIIKTSAMQWKQYLGKIYSTECIFLKEKNKDVKIKILSFCWRKLKKSKIQSKWKISDNK